MRYSYSLLLNGIALECAYGHIAELDALPGVKAVPPAPPSAHCSEL